MNVPEDGITIREACEMLHMERPNVQALKKKGVIKELGMFKTTGDSWRVFVSKQSVLEYMERKLNYSDDRAVFKVTLSLDVYEKIVEGKEISAEEWESLRNSFRRAVNETVRMAEYHATRRQQIGGDTTTEEMTDDDLDVDNDDAEDEE